MDECPDCFSEMNFCGGTTHFSEFSCDECGVYHLVAGPRYHPVRLSSVETVLPRSSKESICFRIRTVGEWL